MTPNGDLKRMSEGTNLTYAKRQHGSMRDIIDDLAPGSFNTSNAAEVVAVLLGGYFLFEGRTDLGLILIAAGVGYENIDKLRDHA